MKKLFVFDQEIFDRTVSKYKMDELEKRSYQINLIWHEKVHKYFPNSNHGKIKKGDPRKSWIFKNCYKLVRETAGLLDVEDFELYVQAQLEILKVISKKNFVSIDASILAGEKAWRRWKFWKSKYDEKMQKPVDVSFFSSSGTYKALKGLQDTFDFFQNKFGKTLDFDEIKNYHSTNDLFLWINFGKISPYYLTISPYCTKVMTKEDLNRLKFDPAIYKGCIDDQVISKFKELFINEGKSLD